MWLEEASFPNIGSNSILLIDSWTGYINKKPEEFENPVEFSFDKSSTTCDTEDCSNITIVRCSWCKKSLCLKYFFHRVSLL